MLVRVRRVVQCCCTSGTKCLSLSASSTSTNTLRISARRYATTSAAPSSTTTVPTRDGIGPNDDILRMLSECKEHYAPERYKPFVFQVAAKEIAALPTRVDLDELNLKGVGKGIMERIRLVVEGRWTGETTYREAHNKAKAVRATKDGRGRSRKGEDTTPTPTPKPKPKRHQPIPPTPEQKPVFDELRQIPWLGRLKAAQLVTAGCTSIEHLNSSKDLLEMLTSRQKASAQYFMHTRVPVTRDEAERLAKQVQSVLDQADADLKANAERYAHNPSIASTYLERVMGWQVHLVGPWRRAFPVGGDIEVLLVSPKYDGEPEPPTESPEKSTENPRHAGRKGIPFYSYWQATNSMNQSPLVRGIVPALRKGGLVVEVLRESAQRWLGIIRASPPPAQRFRRLDITIAPWSSRAFALLALTGDLAFWEHLQSEAERMGMHLNEYGLWQWEHDANATTTGRWVLVTQDSSSSNIVTEDGILLALGLQPEMLNPARRNFNYIKTSGKRGGRLAATRHKGDD